jgi:hypothetical protein
MVRGDDINGAMRVLRNVCKKKASSTKFVKELDIRPEVKRKDFRELLVVKDG